MSAQISTKIAAAGIPMLGPNCMGIATPGFPSPWIGSLHPGVRRRAGCHARPFGIDRRDSGLAGAAGWVSHRDLGRQRDGHRCGRLRRVLLPGSRHSRRGACSSKASAALRHSRSRCGCWPRPARWRSCSRWGRRSWALRRRSRTPGRWSDLTARSRRCCGTTTPSGWTTSASGSSTSRCFRA